MQQQPYADIHHFAANNDTGVVDDDGDPVMGWYFQLMQNQITPLTALIGPYGSHGECEKAAIREWQDFAA